MLPLRCLNHCENVSSCAECHMIHTLKPVLFFFDTIFMTNSAVYFFRKMLTQRVCDGGKMGKGSQEATPSKLGGTVR